MTLTDENIVEIAELLDCGMICYFHRPIGTVESHPAPNESYFDPDPWQDIIDRVENDWGNYEQFEKMDSNQEFQTMENFAYSLTDLKFRDKILDRLSKRKPFQNFKILINSSDYRQDWFDFKEKAYIDHVKQHIEITK